MPHLPDGRYGGRAGIARGGAQILWPVPGTRRPPPPSRGGPVRALLDEGRRRQRARRSGDTGTAAGACSGRRGTIIGRAVSPAARPAEH
ncbi:hypothetical protein [Streptosporangium sp. NPDC049644]|uniref:hypothetical protein n=1 Tax=Streptosporangium sp. NPDC049644 TaxID=3155507 RepID=UPI0034475790